MAITRTSWIDDDGTGTTGTVINNAEKQLLYDQIDAALVQYMPLSGGTLTGNVILKDTTTYSLIGSGSNGVGIAATHGAGGIRFYSGGTVERMRVHASGALSLGTGSDPGTAGGVLVADSGGYQMINWPTTAAAANVHTTTGDILRMVSSVRADKHAERTITADEARQTILGLRGVLYKSRIDDDQRDWAGFIADDAARVNPVLTTRDAAGLPRSVTYDRVPAYLVPLAQDHEARLARLEHLIERNG